MSRWRILFNLGTSEIQIARIQFPFRLVYAMAFNKAHGQAFDAAVLIDFTTGGAFAHGHVYAAMSRVRNPLACAAYVCAVDTSQTQGDVDFDSCTKQNMVTPHIVHTQLLRTDDDNAADIYAVSPSDQRSQLLSIRSLLNSQPPPCSATSSAWLLWPDHYITNRRQS